MVLIMYIVLILDLHLRYGLQREAVGRLPTDEEITKAREIGTSAYLDEIASQGTQVNRVNIRQVVIFYFLSFLITAIV